MPRYAMDLGDELDSKLSRMGQSAKQPAKNKEDAIRRAVALYLHLHEQVAATPGAKVAIIDSKNDVLQIIDPLP